MPVDHLRCECHVPETGSKDVGRGNTPLIIRKGHYYTTQRVYQATYRLDSEMAGPRQADEGHVSPTAEGRRRDLSPTASCRPQARISMNGRTGQRLMLPLASSLTCTLAENLQNSRVRPHFAFCKTAKRKKGGLKVHKCLYLEQYLITPHLMEG